MIRYLISDGSGDVDHIRGWLGAGIDVVQIRERQLTARELAEFTHAVMAFSNPHGAKILVNDRADVALACGAHGVHLRDGSVSAEVFAGTGLAVSISCHTVEATAAVRGANFILLAPVFHPVSKPDDQREPLGLDILRRAAASAVIPVLALGGITASNAPSCIEAGAAGVAGISLFKLV